ncbi:MAG: hypothetical protein IKV32_02500 [Muribaculaceae bacterium]|nr:hypothetical protein [Muribaculaceae bacterium]
MTQATYPTSPIYATGFSWNRVKMLFAFYFPILKHQIIAYALAAFLVHAFSLFLIRIESLFWILTLLGYFALLYALYWNPIIFTRRNFHLVETMLPISGNEKVVFYTIYSFVIVPITMLLGIIAATGFMYIFPGTRELIASAFNLEIPEIALKEIAIFKEGIAYIISAIASAIGMIATSLFAVVYFKKNKALMAIILSLGSSIALGIVGSILGFLISLQFSNFNSALNFTIYTSSFISITYCIVMLYLSIRTIKYRQV